LGCARRHGGDDHIVPFADSAPLSAKLLKHATLKVYPGFPHGMCTTHADIINADLLAFIRKFFIWAGRVGGATTEAVLVAT
jgi:fermentation-respiration switch protein FrsA (DUF1100 family)